MISQATFVSRDRLIVALDVDTLAAADALAEQLAGAVRRLKVGLELFTAFGPEALRVAARRGANVMLDLKLHDIPETVGRAVARAADLGAELLTIHIAGGRRMMDAAVAAARRSGTKMKLLGVTVLTSLEDRDLAEIAVEPSVPSVVARRATLAMEAGLDGVVSSPNEAAMVRAAAPEGFLIVTPGIRPATGGATDDQRRVATPAAARAAGADFIVVGRPIRDAADPRAAAEAIVAELSEMSRVIYGQNPVREAVVARAQSVSVIYVAAGDTGPAIKQLKDLASGRKVTVEERDRDELDALAGADARHQGVVAIVGELVYADLEDVLDDLEARTVVPLLVVLDSVQDPRNLGAIIRSAHVLGAHAVVIGKDRSAPVTAVAVKASAGATEHLPIAQVTNVVRALEVMKERGVWTVGAVATAGSPAPQAIDLKGPIALVLGAEGKGLRPLVERNCDHKVLIPMSGRVASLNVSVAAGILLYEAARQRGTG